MNQSFLLKQQHAYSIIETLTSVFVLSIGLLGLAGMQTAGINYNYSTLLRTQAVMQAYNLAERMQANVGGAMAGDYNNPSQTAHADCLATVGCTMAQMAQNDFDEWMRLNATLLPSGSGGVCVDSNPYDANNCDGLVGINPVTHIITVRWQEKGQAKVFNFPVRIFQ